MSIRPKRYILLPANNIQANAATTPDIENFLLNLSTKVAQRSAVKLAVRNQVEKKKQNVNVNVVDSIHENGAKLVAIKDDELADFRFSYPGLRIIPEKFYKRAFRFEPESKGIRRAAAGRAAVSVKTQISLKDKAGKTLTNAYVVAFTNFAAKEGDGGNVNSSGTISLTLSSKKIERLYVYPDHSYWGYFKKSFTIAAALTIKLEPIVSTYVDSLRHFYDTKNWAAVPANVRVGIIDTGFGPHKDVTIKAGTNMVLNEPPANFQDLEGHGTHVAGIIAGNGAPKGVAAGVDLFIYRVFPKGDDASNFDIMKAIDRAKTDQCDFVNMSLGEEALDEGIMSSIKDAYSAGTICFAANGNEDRSAVSFPASYSLSIAVSAMGRKGTFPASTVQSGIVKSPFGSDKKNFIADFSNIGPETDLTAPGVGIISTFPNDLYAIMDGTSMACPAATGMAARLLSTQATILAMPRNQARADAVQKFLSTKIKSMGFAANFEGKGMLVP